MLYYIGQLYVYPDYTTQLMLKSGRAHVNGQFLYPNATIYLPSGFLTYVTIVYAAYLYFTPEPAVKFLHYADDAVLRSMHVLFYRLQTSDRIQICLHLCRSPYSALTQINFLQANSVDVVLVDLSQYVLPACYYLTRQAFYPNLTMFNPLVFPALEVYFKRLIDHGLQVVSDLNRVIKYAVLLVLAPSVDEKFANLAAFRQQYYRILQIFYESTFEYELQTFTDSAYFGQQCDIGIYNQPGFLTDELRQSIQAQTLRRYFYGSDEKLTPKSVEIPRDKVVFMEVKYDYLVEIAYGFEFKYGFIKSAEGNEALMLVKVQSISKDIVQLVVCSKEVVEQEQICIITSNVDII